ncbi:MAG: TetR/AcrR family transcriptional regulator [Alphaproteobacteria bacterium]
MPRRKAPAARPTRAEKSAATRRALIRAATEVVGEHGYAGASVARITARAKVAQGTFYNYFRSRQDLLDSLLPQLGRDLLDHVRAEVAGSAGVADMEARGLRAFFDFLVDVPGFYRVLNEAETLAPRAHKRHFALLTDRYVAALARAQQAGELQGYRPDELEALVYILMAARSYLALRYAVHGKRMRRVPDSVVATWAKFVASGLGTTAPAPGRRKTYAT